MSTNTNLRRSEQALQCFNQIKDSISEAGERIEVSRLLEKLKGKGCSNVDKRSIISITVNEGGYTPEVEACPEPESEKCSCELKALFTVRKEGNDSIVEIYNPKKHGWWEDGRMVRPPSAKKEPPPINSLNINNYWHHLTLDCYFKWVKQLYNNECSVTKELKELILSKRTQLLNYIKNSDIENFKRVSLELLEKLKEKYSTILNDQDFSKKLKSGLRLSFSNINKDCFRNIFNLLEKSSRIEENNYQKELHNLVELIYEISSNGQDCRGLRTNAISILLTFINPNFFLPFGDIMTSSTLAKMAEEIKRLFPKIHKSEIKPQSCKDKDKGKIRFVGSSVDDKGSIECVIESLIIMNFFRIKAGIPTLFELFCPLIMRTKEEIEKIEFEKNLLLYGPPGTGKTYEARARAKELSKGKNNNIKFTTFHPSFAYENFIEGIWPEIKDGQIYYTIKDGIFKELSIEAMWNALVEKNAEETDYKTKKEEVITALKKIQSGEANEDALFNFEDAENFVLIIDEINRGNIPSIFGELISLIEENKRLGESEALITTLPYSREPFAVPKNLYIIGTMNTTDRSVVIMDAALRRRFHFEEIAPNPNLLNRININGIDIKELLQKINKEITKIPYLERDYQIGHSYFLELRENRSLEKLVEILRKKVLPLLQEYFHGRWEDLEKVLGEKWKKFIDETGRITLKSVEDLSDREKVISLIKSIYSVNEERRQDERTDEDNN